MKPAKIAAVVLGTLVVLLALVLVLALTPAVQTWAVRKALAGQPGMKAEIGHVSAGFSAADIRDFRIEKDGAIISGKGVTANYSAWDYLSKKRINVDQLTVTDLLVDLRKAKPADATASTTDGRQQGGTASAKSQTGSTAPAKSSPGRTTESANASPFEGLLSQAKLPFDVRVAKLDVKGRALLPNEQSANFELQGANIETGQRGKLDFRVDFADARKDSPVQALRSNGTASVHIATDRRIDVVELDATASAQGPKLPKDQLKLTAKAEQPTAGGNENYVVNVGLDRSGRVERILSTTARFEAAQKEFAGGWELAIRSEQLAAVLAGFGLPEVAANGAGKFSFKPDTGAASASGELQGNITALEKISPELKQIGGMQFKTSFDGGLTGNAARLERFQLEADTRDGRKLAQINTTQRVGFDLTTKRVSLADPKSELARVAIQALPLAWAQPFVKALTIDSGQLSLTLAVEAEPDGSRIRARSIEPLAIRSLTVRKGDTKLADQVTLTVRPQIDYSATRIVAELADLNVSMPAGDSVAGKLGADVTNLSTTPAIAFTSQLQAKVVAALRPYLPLDPGPLNVSMAAEGRLQGDVLHIAKANANVDRAAGGLLTAVELQQPLTANLAKGTATVPKPAATAARLRLGEVPLAWAQAFVPKSKLAGSLAGTTVEVSFRSADDITVNLTEPLVARGVSATLDGKAMVESLDLTVDLTATKRGDAVTYDVRRLEIKQGNAPLMSLNASGQAQLKEKMTLAAKGNIDADVAALMKQPVAKEFATLSRGRLTSNFEANIGDAVQAKAVLSAKNLVAREGNRSLGDLDVSLDATMKADGSGSVSAPVTLVNANRKSDVTVVGTFAQSKDKKSFLFAGRITGNQIFVDDFQPLAALAPSAEKPAAPGGRPPPPAPGPSPRTPAPTRDTKPFWAGVQGKVQVDVKRVVYGPSYVITALHGGATITENRLALDGLEGRFNENPFKTNAGITFNAQQAKPYSLTGSADVANFDVAAILRGANPNEKPALESKVNVLARLNGNGGTVADLAKNVYGQFDLSGGSGVVRMFRRHGQTVSAVSSIVGILGAVRGSDTTVAVAEIARLLDEMRFDSFKMHVERGADLNLKISSLEFISPIMRTMGSGSVVNKGGPDAPLENQPMQIQFQLGAKAELAHLLNRVGLLTANQDDKGYNLLSQTFTVGGTMAKPDSTSLWQIIGAAAARAAASSLLR